jgi:hypothetical protein
MKAGTSPEGDPVKDYPKDTPGTRPPHVRQADTTLSDAERYAAHLECWECNCHGFVDGVDWCQDGKWDTAMAARAAAKLDPDEDPDEDPIDSGLAAVRYEGVFGHRPDAAARRAPDGA